MVTVLHDSGGVLISVAKSWERVKGDSDPACYYPRMRRGNAFGRVCLCVCLCVCPVRALTLENLDLQT